MSRSGSPSRPPRQAPGGDLRGDLGERRRAGGAVDERQSVDERGRADRADHQILQPRLQRTLAPVFRGAQHIQRDREQLEADEQRHQILRRDEHGHAEHAEQQQRVVLAVAGRLRRASAQRQQHAGDRRNGEDHVEHERQVIDRQGAGDDRRRVVEAADGDHHERGQQRDRDERHHPPAGCGVLAAAQQADEQHDHRAAAQDAERHERRPVDVGALEMAGRGGDGQHEAHGAWATWCACEAVPSLPAAGPQRSRIAAPGRSGGARTGDRTRARGSRGPCRRPARPRGR